MVKKKSILIFGILLFICLNLSAQVNQKMKLEFENKKQITEWGNAEFGYTVDTLSIQAGDKNLFIFLGDFSSSGEHKTVYIFVGSDIIHWSTLSILYTGTNWVKIEVDDKKREVIFKADSGKTLMELSFDAID